MNPKKNTNSVAHPREESSSSPTIIRLQGRNPSLIKRFLRDASYHYFTHTLSFNSLHLLSFPLFKHYVWNSPIRKVALHLFNATVLAPVLQDSVFSDNHSQNV